MALDALAEPVEMTPPNEAPHPNHESATPSFSKSWLGRCWRYLSTTVEGRYLAGFIAIAILALTLRLWELAGRTMHYDEAIHLYYSWRLSNLEGFVHSPWMHGPLQIELVALFLRLFGDTDFAARLAYALFGTVLVTLPFFLRDYLGRAGAMITGAMLAISPSLLYFSRFGRNDIIMAVLTVALFTLLWRYSHHPRNRHLFLAAAVLAVAFATKETAYIISAIFGALALLLAMPWANLAAVPLRWYRARGKDILSISTAGNSFQDPRQALAEGSPPPKRTLRIWNLFDASRVNPAGGFLLLLVTLSLPLWSAGVELIREVGVLLAGNVGWAAATDALEAGFGLTLVARDGISQGIVGAPLWAAPFVQLPLPPPASWIAGIILVSLILFCGLVGWKLGSSVASRMVGFFLPVGASLVAGFSLLRPSGSVLDTLLSLLGAAVCLAIFALLGPRWRHSFCLIFLPFLATMAYSILFLPVLGINTLLPSVLPEGVEVSSDGNAVPLNFLVAGGILLALIVLSLAVGLRWKGGVWLVCIAIFGSVWCVLYTTFFSNPAGIFSGSWQGLGYWIAQQEVARGNQPWYYYAMGMSVYEFLPLAFGTIAAALFVLRRDPFGMALAFWAFVNFFAYTIASEKMPWLLVNITLPFIYLAGKLLGELVDRVNWSKGMEGSQRLPSLVLLGSPSFLIAASGYVVFRLADGSGNSHYPAIFLLVAIILLSVLAAWLVRRSSAGNGSALASLGIAGFLAAATAWVAVQAAYTHDDSRPEILVYAQGSYDLREGIAELERLFLQEPDSALQANPVRVDYDAWYPLQWYVRHYEEKRQLRFTCFKDKGGDGGCSSPADGPDASAFLVAAHHRPDSPGSMQGFRELETRRNLLWFPETYRRPGEDRQREGAMEEILADLAFFRDAAIDQEKWRQALGYLFFREMESGWFKSEYYTYVRHDSAVSGELR